MDPDPQTTPDTSLPGLSPIQQHEANLLRALEISPYELVVLEKHLLSYGWIPQTTNEEAIKEAVFQLRESFFAANCYKFHRRVSRLNTLFEEDPDDEDLFGPVDETVAEAYDRRLSRDTAKYNAVRTLITDLAFRESRKRQNGGQAY